jgi:hypothetical protein
MAHVLVVIAAVLVPAGFAAAFTLLVRLMFPRSAARVRGCELIYPGGMTSGMWTGTWGTASLALGSGQVAIRGRGPFRPLIRWEARYDQISQVQAVRGAGLSGLLLRGPGGPIAFWTPRWTEIADLLDLQAVPVDRSVSKLSRNDLS